MLPHGRRFVGRERDVATLTELLRGSKTKVICIIGESGIGKTALANRLFEQADSERFKQRFRHFAFRPGRREGIGWEGLEDWLTSSLAREVLSTVTPNASRTELVNSILAAVAEESTLLLLDNVETLEQEWLEDLMRQWLQRANESLLIVTTTQDLPFDPEVTLGYELYPLGGFAEDEREAILAFLQDMRSRFDDSWLLAASRKLGNSPQRLLWLQWQAPQKLDDLHRLVDELSVGAASKDLVEAVRERIKGPLTHFLALGHVRTIEIEESLFSWLWDRLGGSSAAAYTSVRDQLIAEGFLARQHGTDILRINPSIHIQLENYLERNIGPVHVGHVDYYLSEYYREEFEKQADVPDMPLDMSLLGRYVYHAIEAGNLGSALDFVLAPARLRLFHNLGLALGLRPVFSMLDSHITGRLKKVEAELSRLKARTSDKNSAEGVGQLLREREELPRFHVVVSIELAQCDNDLSNHEQCLAYLDEAEKMLHAFSDESSVISLRQSINYLRGISFSDLGRSLECVRAYTALVEAGVGQQMVDERVILALGYLAFELRFHDEKHARVLGERALALAIEHGEPSLIAKNECSLAQTLFFLDHIDEAAGYFKEAEDRCRGRSGRVDRRELGRILIHQSMVPIQRGQYDEAIRMLEQSDEIHNVSGDRRRLATSMALRGIASWRMGQPEEGKKLLEQAIAKHREIKDWRNATQEALSYAFMLGYTSRRGAIEAAASPSHRNEMWAQTLSDPSAKEPLKLFGTYWASYFRPLLLE